MSVVLAHVAHIDTRLQRIVYTTNIKTRNELQNELRAFAFAKKKEHPFENNSAGKRQRTHGTIKCHFCGRMGHKLVDCRLRSNAAKPKQGSNPNSGRSSDAGTKAITCYKCGALGHFASACTEKNESASHKKNG